MRARDSEIKTTVATRERPMFSTRGRLLDVIGAQTRDYGVEYAVACEPINAIFSSIYICSAPNSAYVSLFCAEFSVKRFERKPRLPPNRRNRGILYRRPRKVIPFTRQLIFAADIFQSTRMTARTRSAFSICRRTLRYICGRVKRTIPSLLSGYF